jgi:hypothetical protein
MSAKHVLTEERAAKMRRVALVDQYCQASNEHQYVLGEALYFSDPARGGDPKKALLYIQAMAVEFERLFTVARELNMRLPRRLLRSEGAMNPEMNAPRSMTSGPRR